MTIEVFSRPPRDPQLSSGSSRAVKSSPHWFGLPILLWALSFSVQAGCVESAKVCTDSDDRTINGTTVHRDCWRWEMTYACTEDSPEKDRCESAALPQTCAIVGEACSASDADAGASKWKRTSSVRQNLRGPALRQKIRSFRLPSARLKPLLKTPQRRHSRQKHYRHLPRAVKSLNDRALTLRPE